MKRFFTAGILVFCFFSGCEKERVEAPLGEGVRESGALADSLEAAKAELLSRVAISESLVARLGNAVWRDVPKPPSLDTAKIWRVSASEPVRQ